MMAYHKDINLPRVQQSSFPPRSKDMNSSMLQYSDRMRMISTARINLGDDMRTNGSGRNNGASNEVPRHANPSHERRGLPKSEFYSTHKIDIEQRNFEERAGQGSSKARKQRPLSFDEKELQMNLKAVKTHRRPLSFDNKELQKNKEINLQHRQKQPQQIREAFTSSLEEDSVPQQQKSNEVRISFVNASDLFDLVDLNQKTKLKSISAHTGLTSPARLLDVSNAIKMVEGAGSNASRYAGRDQRITRNNEKRDAKSRALSEKRVKTINLGLNISTDLLSENVKDVLTEQSSADDEEDDFSPTDVDTISPLAVFLQQAVTELSGGQNVLSQRPKRAKRMSLRKPRLLDIPEDCDSHSRGGRRGSTKKLPEPSAASLQAIAELRDSRTEKYDGRMPDTDNCRLTCRSRIGESSTTAKDGSDISYRASTVKNKSKVSDRRSDLDVDSMLSTSIYPPLPWELESDQAQQTHTRRQVIFPEKTNNSPKEKAHKKMKKLIFLRDRPDQHYRRDS